jgi:16S rRNA (uracil1498-N3)-methyltransferase
MPARLYVPLPLREGAETALPAAAARHVQVLRLQPGAALALFDGSGAEWDAEVVRIGRSEVAVRVGACRAVDRELAPRVTLAVGMPANERMDALVEKATELGVAAIRPLLSERSVLRLAGERAERRREHWQAVAEAACEQCGRSRVPRIEAIAPLGAWLAALPPDAAGADRWLLSPAAAGPPRAHRRRGASLIALSGPEGGLSAGEEAAARAHGFVPVSLGPRVLRADTAPLALLAWIGLDEGC